jgi:hypothetical protein
MRYPNFQHHPDGWIIVRRGQNKVYSDTIANFEVDYGNPYTGLPEGFIGRYYEPGVNHYVHTDDTAVPQGLSWLEGDAYIEAYERLIAAKADRETLNQITI